MTSVCWSQDPCFKVFESALLDAYFSPLLIEAGGPGVSFSDDPDLYLTSIIFAGWDRLFFVYCLVHRGYTDDHLFFIFSVVLKDAQRSTSVLQHVVPVEHSYLLHHNLFSFTVMIHLYCNGPDGSVIEHPLREREVSGSNPRRAIQKTLKRHKWLPCLVLIIIRQALAFLLTEITSLTPYH